MFDVIIIGAGFSGLYQLYSLKKNLNLNCHLFEKAPSLKNDDLSNIIDKINQTASNESIFYASQGVKRKTVP